MVKKLLFNYYDSKYGDNEFNDYHFKCIEKYIDIFDEVEFVLTTDFTDDEERKSNIINKIYYITPPSKPIDIKVYENNDHYITSKVYNEEVVSHFGEDKYVFFAHNKGFVFPDNSDRDNIKKYIYGLYYFSLEHMYDVLESFSNKFIAYGSFPSHVDRYKSPHKWSFSGGFHWVNLADANNFMNERGFVDHEIGRNEYYYEDFFAYYTELGNLCKTYSNGCVFHYTFVDYFNNIDELCRVTYGVDEYNEFIGSYSDFVTGKENVDQSTKTACIVYIATGKYIYYANKFFETLHNFLPQVKKNVKLLTDNNVTFDEYKKDNINIDVIHYPQLIYPFTNIHKMKWINEVVDKDCDYTFYFDSDTYFLDSAYSDSQWDNFVKNVEDGYIMLTKHQGYLTNNVTFWMDGWYYGVTDRNPSSNAYISDVAYTYIISSFFGGKTNIVTALCDKVCDMMKADLCPAMKWHIPMLYDENYVNKLNWLYETNQSFEFLFHTESFNTFHAEENVSYEPPYTINEIPASVFMVQKNMEEYKDIKAK